MKDTHPVRRQRRRARVWPQTAQIEDWHAALERLYGAYSPHTLLSYEADFRLFLAWCTRNGCDPLPAMPETAAAYLAAEMHLLKPSTLKRALQRRAP